MNSREEQKCKNVKITTIVTVHNTEKFLRECLDSVCGQTFSEIEILCIDGGSTDDSPEILREYFQKDSRIKIINDPDTGYGHKVNRGIREAKGKYISVLEADDMYEPFMLEKLYEAAEKYQTDFVNADYTCFFDMNGKRFRYVTKMYPDKDYDRVMEYRKHPEEFGIIPRYWTGIFRKSFLEREQIRMNESPGASFQDMSFRFLTSILADTAYHLDLPVYLYRIDNPSSSMHDQRKTIEIADEHDFLKTELMKRGITDKYIWHNAYQWKYTDFRGNLSLLKGDYRRELLKRYREELEKDRDALNRYSEIGYSPIVLEMITESQERIEELIEYDVANAEERNSRLYCFLNDVMAWGDGWRAVLFGCGARGRVALHYLQSAGGDVCALADNLESLWDTYMDGYRIVSPERAVALHPNAHYVIANKFHADEMKDQLLGLGIFSENIIVF